MPVLIEDIRTKVCSRCKEEKSIHAFYKQPGGKYGVAGECSECSSRRCSGFARSVYGRGYRLKTTYGLSIEEYNVMYNKQEGKCLICLQVFDKLCVDHDHKTSKVRGLLCRKCNTIIGQADDDVVRLLNAAMYLRRSA